MNEDPAKPALFDFEADFAADLRCIPMLVRRKLDLAGVKLKLVHWHGLSEAERRQVLHWPDDTAALLDLRQWLLERSSRLPQGAASTFEPVQGASWQQTTQLPEELRLACQQLGVVLQPDRWGQLDGLQRFALVKLSHPGHEHRNLPRALLEFGLIGQEEQSGSNGDSPTENQRD